MKTGSLGAPLVGAHCFFSGACVLQQCEGTLDTARQCRLLLKGPSVWTLQWEWDPVGATTVSCGSDHTVQWDHTDCRLLLKGRRPQSVEAEPHRGRYCWLHILRPFAQIFCLFLPNIQPNIKGQILSGGQILLNIAGWRLEAAHSLAPHNNILLPFRN